MSLQKLVKSNVQNQDNSATDDIQDTSFTRDAVSRFVFNTLEEAQNAAPEGFDIIVVGAGMYGGYCATKLFNFTKNLQSTRSIGCCNHRSPSKLKPNCLECLVPINIAVYQD